MREEWYGDPRDLVKWGTLVHLARYDSIRTIIQVAFFRVSERPQLESDGHKWRVADEVWRHFRDLGSIRELAHHCRLAIHIIDACFNHHYRDAYFGDVIGALRADRRRKVVFLDPDTGIEPGKRTVKHVGIDEITEVWRVLNQRDWLVVYQHGPRYQNPSVTPWRDAAREKFARACKVAPASVRMFVSESATDVAFFATAKR